MKRYPLELLNVTNAVFDGMSPLWREREPGHGVEAAAKLHSERRSYRRPVLQIRPSYAADCAQCTNAVTTERAEARSSTPHPASWSRTRL